MDRIQNVELKTAMEMPLMWKLRKNKKRFPSIPTIAWKSQKTAFPHSHSLYCWVFIFE
jgi:hypothetical protein